MTFREAQESFRLKIKMEKTFVGIFLLAVIAFSASHAYDQIENLTFQTSHCTGNGDRGMDLLGAVSVKVKNLDNVAQERTIILKLLSTKRLKLYFSSGLRRCCLLLHSMDAILIQRR